MNEKTLAEDILDTVWTFDGVPKYTAKAMRNAMITLINEVITRHENPLSCSRCGDPIKVGVCENCVTDIEGRCSVCDADLVNGYCPNCQLLSNP